MPESDSKSDDSDEKLSEERDTIVSEDSATDNEMKRHQMAKIEELQRDLEE